MEWVGTKEKLRKTKMTDNELIAKFMGIEWNDYERLKRNYESDWGELMPVVDRIESLSTIYTIVSIDFSGCLIVSDGMKDIATNTLSGISKIEAVYKAVVEFIKWYDTRTG